MKHICKVMTVEVLPDFRPLIALDEEGNVVHINELPIIPPTPTIFYYSDGTSETSDDTVLTKNSYNKNKTLIRVNVGTCVTEIQEGMIWSFYDGLEVYIPSSVTTIGEHAIASYSEPFTIYIDSSTPTFSLVDGQNNIISAFGGTGKSSNPMMGTIIVPDGCKQAYINYDAGWAAYARNIVDPSEIIPSDEIWYTSTDGKIVEPCYPSELPGIASNTYENGKGIIKFEEDITSIGDMAFLNCETLETIEFPEGLLSIGESAFLQCTALKHIVIPSTVTTINDSAVMASPIFDDTCYIEFKSSTPNITLEGSSEGSIIYAFGNYRDSGASNFVIVVPEGSERDYASYDAGWEYYASHIQNMIEGTEIRYTTSDGNKADIDMYAFPTLAYNTYDTSGGIIKCFTIIDEIGEGAFSSCTNLSSITIPSEITTIGNYAFSGCLNLTHITIPSTVTSIGDNVFYDAYNWSETHYIQFESVTPNISLEDDWGSVIYAFGNFDDSCAENFVIQVPSNSESAYASHDAGWEYYSSHIQGFDYTAKFIYADNTKSYAFSSSISSSSFDNQKHINSIEFTDDITRIENNAFASAHVNAYENNPIIIPASVTYLGLNSLDILGSSSASKYIKFITSRPTVSLVDGNNNIIYAFSYGRSYSEYIRIIVPAGCKQNYVGYDDGWAAFANNIIEE